MDFRDVVKAGLEALRYDGLYSDVAECGCKLDDLMPCGQDNCFADCQPGYQQPADHNKHWYIGPNQCLWVCDHAESCSYPEDCNTRKPHKHDWQCSESCDRIRGAVCVPCAAKAEEG